MNFKSMTIKEMGESGKGLALLATLSAVDHDGDTYQPGAFGWMPGGEQWVMLIPAHDRRAMPYGKARVYEEGDFAFAELHLNLDTEAGREWHAALKFDLATGKPVQEWSYGYEIKDMDYQVRGNSRVRVLKRVAVDEVSSVLRGAGRGTGTVAMKGALKNAALRDERFKGLIADLADLSEAVAGEEDIIGAAGMKQLADIQAALGKALAAASGAPADDDAAHAEARALLGDFMAHQVRAHLRR
jgi:hypothetical protein